MEQQLDSASSQLSPEQFARFRKLIYERSGIALRPEKQLLLSSRLSRRMRVLGLSSFDDYYQQLASADASAELEHFLNAITTNKTSFFREAHHFDELRERVIVPKLRAATQPVRLRVWSAGCSTGEEPYSIMVTLLEAVSSWETADIRVLASDLDTDVLATGERGVYADEKFEELPPESARRWFVRGTGDKRGYFRARNELRTRIAFRRINFVDPSWPINTRFDAIFCRNALIYFDAATQRLIVERLLQYLLPSGYLFLGHSESMAGVRPDLESLGRTTYRYLGGTR